MEQSIHDKIRKLIKQKENQLGTYQEEYNDSMEVHNNLRAYKITIKAKMVGREIDALEKLIKE